MRAQEIAREAWRNIRTGTTRAAALALMLGVAIVLAALLEAEAVSAIMRSAQDFQRRGANILTITAKDGISPVVCERLAGAQASPDNNVTAAGAIRAAESDLAPVALPQGPIPSFEVSPGFGAILGLRPGSAKGLLLSTVAAEQLGVSAGSEITVRGRSSAAKVRAVFPYPSDGRDGQLEFASLAEVPSSGSFDACWVRLRHLRAGDEELLRVALRPGLVEGADVTVRQLNGTSGSSSPTALGYQHRVTRWLKFALLLFGLGLGGLAIWLRRLELAAAQHAGLSRVAQLWHLLLETSAWLLAAWSLSAPWLVWGNLQAGAIPDVIVLLHLKIALAAGCGVLLGTLLAAAAIRERHLFRFFKAR